MENEELKFKIEAIEKAINVLIETISADQKENALLLKEQIETVMRHNEKIDEGISSRTDLLEGLSNFHNAALKVLELNVAHFESREYFQRINKELKEFIQTQMDKIPPSIQVKHHVEPKSKVIVLIIGVLIISSVLGFGWGLANYSENATLKEGSIKYRMFRHKFPGVNNHIDSIYYIDPERAAKVISKLEAEVELRKAADEKRREAEQEGRKATITTKRVK